MTTPGTVSTSRWSIACAVSRPSPDKVRREDVLGGLAAGWIVFACSFPAVLPFLILDDLHFALGSRTSSCSALLFLVGWQRGAAHAGASPGWRAWCSCCSASLLVALAIPLGG